MIAFLHTSKVHAPRFEALARRYDKDIPIKHFVNETLLRTALSKGKTDTLSFIKEVEKIKQERPSLIICTCSTYGEECENHGDIQRIDRPVAEHLVANYSVIGLVYTAPSTKTVSNTLLSKIASEQQKKIQVIGCDCSEYWPHFEQGLVEQYEKGIAQKIRAFASQVDVVFLAQASMEGAKKYLTDMDKAVFSSPEFGIRAFLNSR